MSITKQLNEIVAERSLLNHPFYQAWSAGTLPVEDLQTYAREYGAFIGMLPRAWDTLKDAETSQEEREHAELWGEFAAALGTRVNGSAHVAEVSDLTAAAARLFADPASAAGALYAFEVQQPATAKSKLEGLKLHYKLPASVEPYFALHSHNEHEAAKLLGRIEAMSAEDRQRSARACTEMADALWNALSGIYGKERMKDC